MKTYAITGATGHTGRPIAEGLLAAGYRVRVLSRSAEHAADLIARGAELFVGSTSDRDVLRRAFAGADAAYLMIPTEVTTPDYTAAQVAHGEAIAEALGAAGVSHAVLLSSIGAHLAEGSGVVLGLHHVEQMLNGIAGLNVLHLRPSYFLENTLMMAGLARHSGILGSPIRGDLSLPVIATADIGAAALRRLRELDFSGQGHLYLLGARDVTYTEIARIYGAAIGKPDLPYVQFGYDEAATAMVGMGLGRSMADKMVEFVRALNEGRVLADTRRTPESTTPTTVEEFAKTFKAAYDAS